MTFWWRTNVCILGTRTDFRGLFVNWIWRRYTIELIGNFSNICLVEWGLGKNGENGFSHSGVCILSLDFYYD